MFSSGKSIKQYPLILYHGLEKLPEDVPCQVGFTVPKRIFRRAVDRNRIKRLMREAYRLNKKRHYEDLLAAEQQAALMIVYIGKEKPEFELVEDRIKTLLKRFSLEIINRVDS